jgi:tetratricopeptide (TPR) repeat protein
MRSVYSKLFLVCSFLSLLIIASCSSESGQSDKKVHQRIDFYKELIDLAQGDSEMKEEYYHKLSEAYLLSGDEGKATKYESLSYELSRNDQSDAEYTNMVKNRPSLQASVIKLCDSYIEQDPNFAHAIFEKAKALFRVQNYKSAKQLADQAFAVDPELWEAKSLSDAMSTLVGQ